MLRKDTLTIFSKKITAITLMMLLCACAYAPGMKMDTSSFENNNANVNQNLNPILKQITSELIIAERLERNSKPAPDVSVFTKKIGPYQLGPGDILAVHVWEYPELSTRAMLSVSVVSVMAEDQTITPGFVVDQNGYMHFSYVGALKVEGLTTTEVKDLLEKKLSRYIKKPRMSVRLHAYRNQRLYVEGEVKTPGTQTMNDVPTNLLEAINRAGGFLQTADQSLVRITRQGKTYPISMPDLVKSGINPSTMILESGDLIRVLSREESRVFVLGEVTVPRPVYMRNSSLMLSEALSEVGGVNPYYSNARQIYVIRNAQENNPIVYHLDARSPISLALATDFMLKPRDVIYIDTAPLALWNRLLNLILPSVNTWLNQSKNL
jgi:polysaccharide biosynthesis/export protein